MTKIKDLEVMVNKVDESIDKVIDLKIQNVEEERNERERRAVNVLLLLLLLLYINMLF